MQQRRFRPGDVLDDYCPRERRITDHAIVAMIDDHIKQTRCVVCDAEHEYKEGKVPPQRRRKAQSALFNQVLDGLQGPQPPARPLHPDSEPDLLTDEPDHDADSTHASSLPSTNGHTGSTLGPVTMPSHTPVAPLSAVAESPRVVDEANDLEEERADLQPVRDEGPVRRPLIRATLPRPEGQPVATRAMPEFTIRQPTNARAGYRGRRGGGQHQGQGDSQGPMRFGRSQGQGQGQGQQRHHGARSHGANGGRPGGGSRRGGKKR